MGYSTPMLEQCNKYNSTHNVSVLYKTVRNVQHHSSFFSTLKNYLEVFSKFQ